MTGRDLFILLVCIVLMVIVVVLVVDMAAIAWQGVADAL